MKTAELLKHVVKLVALLWLPYTGAHMLEGVCACVCVCACTCARHWQGHRNSVVRSLKCSWQQSRPGVMGREGEGQMDGWIERGERSRHAGTKHTERGALWSICCRRWDYVEIRTCTYDEEVCLSALFLSVCATYRHYRTSDNSRSSIIDRACRVNSRVCISAPVWMQYVLCPSVCIVACRHC